MSVQREVTRDRAISGLRLKRKLGEKIRITHEGETLTLQVIAFHTGYQIVLGFEGKNFQIDRSEVNRDVK